MTTALVFMVALAAHSATGAQPAQKVPADEPLLDWSAWQKYRTSVVHPAATVKPDDLRRARENLAKHDWARSYLNGLEKSVQPWLKKLSPEFLVQMIPATTPGDILFTPCPACRDKKKPYHAHGQWKWSASDPDHLTCIVCDTTYPNAAYPESIVLKAQYGGGQEFTYCAGEPFRIFSYIGRPSISGNIRAQKVHFVAGLCRQMAEAYALSGKAEYARAVRQVMLRLAEVYPRWLVHVGYGEYADMDPHVAALNINRLPADELCPAPAKPDRKLHTGYWSAGRASAVGMEAGFVRQMVESYEFVCTAAEAGKPIFSDAERLRIEKDLLLESTVLLVADKGVNNKSVGNATAVALVGMSVGHPGMVRFGYDVFMKTVDGWFLPDGGTSESWDYALMTLNGIEALGQALRGYADPPGYRDPQGQRLENLDLYHGTAYQRVWAAMFNGLQGDLSYPPLADGMAQKSMVDAMTGRKFPIHQAELMTYNYPDTPQYLALLKALAGDDLAHADRALALYYRPTGLVEKQAPTLAFADNVFPALQLGYLRSGPTGRDSALVLSASDWGNHHHQDSLNLYYWQDGQELLTDLGYLWDHPDKHMTVRTFAHNTVMIDGKEQATKGRGGRFTLFDAAAPVKVMEAESQAYPQASLYRRTVAQVEHAPGRQYLVDIFRVQGGATHDYVFHGPNRECTTSGPELQPVDTKAIAPALDLENVRGSSGPSAWQVKWKLAADRTLAAHWPGAAGERFLIGDGWGQRDFKNTDVGAKLPYVVRRQSAGKQPTVFVAAYEGVAGGRAIVKSVKQLPVPSADADNAVVLAIQTDRGVDYVVSCLAARALKVQTPDGLLEVNARFALISLEARRAVFTRRVEGSEARLTSSGSSGS